MDSDNWRRGAVLVSAQCRVGPSLLHMTWDGYPLHYHSRHGWGYLVPGRTANLSQDECEDFPKRYHNRTTTQLIAISCPEIMCDQLVGKAVEKCPMPIISGSERTH
jgi:hypothetical protein